LILYVYAYGEQITER